MSRGLFDGKAERGMSDGSRAVVRATAGTSDFSHDGAEASVSDLKSSLLPSSPSKAAAGVPASSSQVEPQAERAGASSPCGSVESVRTDQKIDKRCA